KQAKTNGKMNGMAKDFAKRRVSFKLPQIILQKAPEITLSEQTIVEASRPLYQTKLRSLNLSPGPISANSMGKSPEETESRNAGVPCILEAVRLNARSSLRELTFDGIGFMKDSERELEALLEDRPSFSCSWSSSIRGSDVSKGFARPDEVVIFMRFVRNMGFRLVDLFKILSPEKQSLSVSKEAFVFGLKRLNAPLRDDQLRVIFDSLDEDGNGTLDFHEFSAMRNHSLAKYVKKNMKKRRSELQKEHIRKIML
ncbi:predicted protein, partial [Nematostella vectensis]